MNHLKIFLLIALTLLLSSYIYYNYRVNQSLYSTFYQITTNKKNIKELRIVELSDLHLKEFGNENERLVEKVKNLGPDLITVVGDMTMEDNPDHSVAINLIKKLVEIAPVYYSAGNHEYTDILHNEQSTLVKEIENAGATFLDDRVVEAEIGPNKLLIGGICKNEKDILKYKSSKGMLESLSKEEEFALLLSHYPEVFISALNEYSFDLALCGHAHGGLVRIPFTDGLYAPDQGFLPKHTSGKKELGTGTVVISRGLANSHVFPRINNTPEIVVIDIN